MVLSRSYVTRWSLPLSSRAWLNVVLPGDGIPPASPARPGSVSHLSECENLPCWNLCFSNLERLLKGSVIGSRPVINLDLQCFTPVSYLLNHHSGLVRVEVLKNSCLVKKYLNQQNISLPRITIVIIIKVNAVTIMLEFLLLTEGLTNCDSFLWHSALIQ
ncbi:hypothetical protein RRG08_003546 [Elysia crispata]|uniref:Uncharacterized protein n=1 Tax=Elysia crispata TaxID=231223 RepID=A0AAE0Y6P9_9GAST|nr:hypothetical protein RRG08_003546 [Elysia crispata]